MSIILTKVFILGTLIFMAFRFAVIYIKAMIDEKEKGMLSDAFRQMVYCLMFLFSTIIFYEGDDNIDSFIKSTKALSFSSWHDFTFILIFLVPVILTIRDINDAKQEPE